MTRTDPRLADFQAVLFDMDGTLLDSTVAVESVWSAWAERNSIPTADVLAWCHGRNVAATITHFLPHIAPETLQSMVSAQLDQECTQLDSVKPAVGGRELLIWLDAHRIPWGVVTNAPRRLALARLGAATIDPPSWSPSRTSSMASRRPTVTSMEPAPAVSRQPERWSWRTLRPARGSTQRRHRSRGCRRTQGCRRRMSRPCRPAPPTRPDTFQVA